MFEHMANWAALLAASGWARTRRRLFLHVFSHRSRPYRFDHRDEPPGRPAFYRRHHAEPRLDPAVSRCFTVESERWSGKHYQRTALDWLLNFDANRWAIDPILAGVWPRCSGLAATLFLSGDGGLFGYRGGEEWGVSHYACARPGVSERCPSGVRSVAIWRTMTRWSRRQT
jgi:cyclopropane-fatty-acyl-phospholipid synthase